VDVIGSGDGGKTRSWAQAVVFIEGPEVKVFWQRRKLSAFESDCEDTKHEHNE
jgi:hypothetical protein